MTLHNLTPVDLIRETSMEDVKGISHAVHVHIGFHHGFWVRASQGHIGEAYM
jgi:hypothetical protein